MSLILKAHRFRATDLSGYGIGGWKYVTCLHFSPELARSYLRKTTHPKEYWKLTHLDTEEIKEGLTIL